MSASVPSTMRYVDITKAGDPEVLQVRERPLPEIADGEVLIKVAGAGLNGADMTQRRGKRGNLSGSGQRYLAGL